MRISQESLVRQSLDRMQRRLVDYERVQVQLGSGRRFQRASEDVGGMSSSLGLREQRRSLEQANRNASDGRARVDVADSRLQGMSTVLRRVRELATRGASTLAPTEREAIATELATLRDELVDLANSRHLGQSLFGGHAADDAVTRVNGVWTYTGDTGAVDRRTGDDESVRVNVTGDQVFGFAGGADLFTMVDRLETDVRDGRVDGVAGALDAIGSAEQDLLTGLARLGAAGRRVEDATNRNLERLEILRTRQSDVEDVDLAEAVMELQVQEVALQATMGALGRALQPSLMDFLR